MFRWHVISAIFWRNLKQYFSGVLGYVVIVAFVTVCAVMTFSQQFFADNQANLDQLSRWYPFLLLFLCPAITMTAWADERRSGTDAILFTLPASDFEITLGKYLAAVAVYTVALLFSLTQLFLVGQLGTPDWGVMGATYLGYWMAGVALIAVGMFASSLTDSTTVAFVLGSMLCAIPVLIGEYFRGSVWLERLGVEWHLQDFLSGLISLPSILYFASLVALMLYLNLVVIGRRHWSRGRETGMTLQYAVRALALGVSLVAANYMAGVWSGGGWTQADLTAERLYTPSPVTARTLQGLAERQSAVTLRAFVSKEVPREFVAARKNLLNLLRQYDTSGGKNVVVEVREVEPWSLAETDAVANGIEPRLIRSEVGGKQVEQKVYLGVVVSAPAGDVTIPFVDADTPLEYELTRGIASASEKKRRISLGIVVTDTHFGGPEFEGRRIPWAYARTLEELEKIYRIQHIQQSDLALYLPVPSEPEPGADQATAGPEKPAERTPPDVLLVPDPASLDQTAAENLVRYMGSGYPVILLCDPLPFRWTTMNPTAIGVLNAPLMPRVSFQSPYATVLTSSFMPKADGGTCRTVMQALGLNWAPGDTAFNLLNPHPNFGGKWYEDLGPTWPEYFGRFEYAFVYARNTGDRLMIRPQTITAGLSELLFFYPGSISPREDSPDLEFIPLVSLGPRTGVLPWDQVTETPKQETVRINQRTGRREITEQAARSQITGEDLIVVRPNPQGSVEDRERFVAALIRGKQGSGNAGAGSADAGDAPGQGGGGAATGSGRREQVVVISDLDFVSELFHDQQQALGQPLDNLRLLMNSIEFLAGDPDFVQLRNRRPRVRTLETVERQADVFRELRAAEQRKLEDEKQKEIARLQSELDEEARKLSADENLNFLQKGQRAFQLEMDANARLDRQRERLEKDFARRDEELRRKERENVSRMENRYRTLAILLAPLPAVLLGLFVILSRAIKENQEVRREHTGPRP